MSTVESAHSCRVSPGAAVSPGLAARRASARAGAGTPLPHDEGLLGEEHAPAAVLPQVVVGVIRAAKFVDCRFPGEAVGAPDLSVEKDAGAAADGLAALPPLFRSARASSSRRWLMVPSAMISVKSGVSRQASNSVSAVRNALFQAASSRIVATSRSSCTSVASARQSAQTCGPAKKTAATKAKLVRTSVIPLPRAFTF
jgi:hypothetical protein